MAITEPPFVERLRSIAAAAQRFWRLVVFGFEQIVLSRLFERHRPLAEGVTAALLQTKLVERQPPTLEVRSAAGCDEAWSHGFSAINAALFLNLRNPDALCAVRHARPAPAFRGVYLWDSAFIAQIWKWWDPEVAWDVLRSVLELREGDRLQHFVSEFARSALTQPPLLAWSLGRLATTACPRRHLAWVDQAFWQLRAYQDWLRRNRRLPNGLYAWAHAYESGVENAPRFGDREERRLRDTRRIAAPDMCAYVVLQCEALAAMASALGHRKEARRFSLEADELRDAVNAQLWDDAEGFYFDLDDGDRGFIKSRSIASLMPLWAGIPGEERANRLIDHILDPGGFNTLIPLPSVAIGDPDFERDMWRGPVWINTAYAVVEGLRRYGRLEIAGELAYRLCDGVFRTFGRTGRFYEFYDPTAYGIRDLHRKRGNRWKAMTLGRKPVIDFVGWTGLVNTMVVETLFGLRLEDGLPVFAPFFPKRAEGRSFTLSLPLWELQIELSVVRGGGFDGVISTGGRVRSFVAQRGEVVPIGEIRHTPSGADA